MLLQSCLTCSVSTFRVLSVVSFRQYIRWLRDQDGAANKEAWYGWMWALLLIAFQLLMIFSQHQQIFFGMRLGLRLKQQVRARNVARVTARELRWHSVCD